MAKSRSGKKSASSQKRLLKSLARLLKNKKSKSKKSKSKKSKSKKSKGKSRKY